MNYKTLFFRTTMLCVVVLALFFSCSGDDSGKLSHRHLMEPDAALSYASVDWTVNPAVVSQATGSSSIASLTLDSEVNIDFDESEDASQLSNTEISVLSFDMNLKQPTMLQVALEVEFDGVTPSAEYFQLEVNGNTTLQFGVLESYDYESNMVALQIPENLLNAGSNKIVISETYSGSGSLLAESIRFLPQKIISSGGALVTTLYTQFGETDMVTGTDIAGNIWTRAYGLSETMEMIPGPTLFYKPGDLVNVKMINLLNPDSSQALNDYRKLMENKLNPDEVLAGDAVRGEINIPHNLNNTNLHVHGLHVDPSKDDVTIVIVPDGEDTTGYDAPHTHAPVDAVDDLNEFSVSDQGVKVGEWLYQYKIPENHLPGTHWFHPHKHGSTSAQVENGLAGTMVIMENTDNAIVPFPNKANSVEGGGNQTDYDINAWNGVNDRVLAIQEITNFGLQKGKGNAKGAVDSVSTGSASNGNPELTVNGVDNYEITIRPGQLERWRLINAGTNHRAFSHVWLGRNTGKKDSQNKNAPIFESATMYMVAADGITLASKNKVTADNPALLAPGNRNDFLVQIDKPGDYVLFKNYNLSSGISIQDEAGKIIYRSGDVNTTFPPAILDNQSKNNAFLFPQTGTTPENYMGFTQNWYLNDTIATKATVPVIKVQPTSTDVGDFVDVDFAVASEFTPGAVGKWTAANVNDGSFSDAELMWINVTGDAVSGNETPKMPSDEYLSGIAPTTSGMAPPYASPIMGDDILQSRPVVFDVSGTAVNVTTTNESGTSSKLVNQFTLNGRFFILNDPIGNPDANDNITKAYTSPSEIESTTDQTNITQKLDFVNAKPIQWNTNKVGDKWYFVNPGYYQPLTHDKYTVLGNQKLYSYDTVGTAPDWSDVTGIPDKAGVPQPAVVNSKATKYDANKAITPGLPLAKTAEEWVLVNNSDVSHPFHIHINPFFIVEVGQLSYEEYTDANGATQEDWFMRAVTAEGGDWAQREAMPTVGAVPGSVYAGEIGVDAIVGNWWDTIVIPAHGYVKVRYWFNVPNQTGAGSGVTVADNFNKTGIWVYHCHILRHEDRGMMMPVITAKSEEEDEEE